MRVFMRSLIAYALLGALMLAAAAVVVFLPP